MPPVALDHREKQEVQYCIPLWLRDLQIAQSIARIRDRIQPHYDRRDAPIALVNFGPSLHDTWEQIRAFRYVMSCSGSHQFLVDRGIVPTWHVEVDPRAHKATLMGPPHPDVEYLIASTCHRAVFDHLEGHKVTLWHVFDNKEDGKRTLPAGEWALTGGCSVGLRTMTIARFLGFHDLHIFGMDGCVRPGQSHALSHPNAPTKTMPCDYNGVTYQTTPSMLEAARGTFHELDQMHDVTPTFYGSGLVQAMAKDWTRAPTKNTQVIGIQKPELISTAYAALNAKLHQEVVTYGVGGRKHADVVRKLATTLATTSVLDYGCGKGELAKALPFPIWEYDPAIPGKEQSPRPADLVVCTDVLEHVEPDKLGPVLDDLRRCTRRLGFFTIHMGPAGKTYADGRNTHLIQRKKPWWTQHLARHFRVHKTWTVGITLYVLVSPRPKKSTAMAASAQVVV
jgi:hypothetical protein